MLRASRRLPLSLPLIFGADPFELQIVAKDGEAKVIECILRASRSLPFSRKAVGKDITEKATRRMMGTTGPGHDAQFGPLVRVRPHPPRLASCLPPAACRLPPAARRRWRPRR